MTRVLRFAGVLAIPTGGAVAAFMLAFLLSPPINAAASLAPALINLLPAPGVRAEVGFGLSVLTVATLAAAGGWRWRGSRRTWTVPLLLFAGVAIGTTWAALLDIETERMVGDLVAGAVWGVGIGAGTAVARVLGRRRRGREALVVGIAAVLASDLAVIVAGVPRVGAADAPRLFAPLWYPSLAFNLPTVFDRAGIWRVADEVVVLPVLVTVASAFVVGYAIANVREPVPGSTAESPPRDASA